MPRVDCFLCPCRLLRVTQGTLWCHTGHNWRAWVHTVCIYVCAHSFVCHAGLPLHGPVYLQVWLSITFGEQLCWYPAARHHMDWGNHRGIWFTSLTILDSFPGGLGMSPHHMADNQAQTLTACGICLKCRNSLTLSVLLPHIISNTNWRINGLGLEMRLVEEA